MPTACLLNNRSRFEGSAGFKCTILVGVGWEGVQQGMGIWIRGHSAWDRLVSFVLHKSLSLATNFCSSSGSNNIGLSIESSMMNMSVRLKGLWPML